MYLQIKNLVFWFILEIYLKAIIEYNEEVTLNKNVKLSCILWASRFFFIQRYNLDEAI